MRKLVVDRRFRNTLKVSDVFHYYQHDNIPDDDFLKYLLGWALNDVKVCEDMADRNNDAMEFFIDGYGAFDELCRENDEIKENILITKLREYDFNLVFKN